MTNFLKKIKLEVNDDMLQYAMAKADTIPQLELFKGHCRPIWLFIASGNHHKNYNFPFGFLIFVGFHCCFGLELFFGDKKRTPKDNLENFFQSWQLSTTFKIHQVANN
jgi:hypothetical protein